MKLKEYKAWIKSKSEINYVRYWSPAEDKIHQRIFLKNEVLFGSDKSADIRLEQQEGFCARLDFQSKELHLLQQNEVLSIKRDQFFQIGGYVFQWTHRELLTKRGRWVLASVASGMLLLVVAFALPAENSVFCTAKEDKIASLDWSAESSAASEHDFFSELSAYLKSYETALQERNFLVAKTELSEIKKLVDVENTPIACGVQRALKKIEEGFSEKLALSFLKSGDVINAAKEVSRFQSLYGREELVILTKRIKSEAKELLFKSWRLKNKDPDKAYEIKKTVREVCLLLAEQGECFKEDALDSRGS